MSVTSQRRAIRTARVDDQVQAVADAWLRVPHHERLAFQARYEDLHAAVSRLTAFQQAQSIPPKEPEVFTKKFWKAAGERALKTLAQSALATATAAGTGLIDTDWIGVASTAGMATVLSLLSSVASSGANDDNGPSLTTEQIGA